jgi:predicted DsbA family dithiol-disulfide isomerase
MPFELRPHPNETLRPEGDYLRRAWQQSVYPIARTMGVPITLPQVSPQPHAHLAFEGYQHAKEHGKGNDYNHRVLEAFFRDGQDIGQIGVLTRLAGEVGLDEKGFQEATPCAMALPPGPGAVSCRCLPPLPLACRSGP